MSGAGESWGPGAKMLLTPEQKQAGMARILAERPKGQPFRLFAFGSLMWNPECCVAATFPATVRNHQRRFQIWSTRARGTPERPGLGLCLVPERGQRCQGLVLELEEDRLEEDLPRLWDREQNSGVYRPTWLPAERLDGTVEVMAFVADTDHPHYVPPMAQDRMAEIMCRAAGRYGTNHDYLVKLLETMAALGAEDPDLRALDACIRARQTLIP